MRRAKVIVSLAHGPGGGLLVMPDNFMDIHRALIVSLAASNKIPAVYQLPMFVREGIVSLAASNKIPAVYQLPMFVREGGLLSYGADFADMFRRAASYVDRILGGATPSELPVQMPTKYVMAVNTKTVVTFFGPIVVRLLRRDR
jgi:hypothetical protein